MKNKKINEERLFYTRNQIEKVEGPAKTFGVVVGRVKPRNRFFVPILFARQYENGHHWHTRPSSSPSIHKVIA